MALANYRVEYRDGTVQHYQFDAADAAAWEARAGEGLEIVSVTREDPEPKPGPLGDFEGKQR